MIGKVLQNNNFRETTGYVLGKEEARLIGGTVIGTTPETISREFSMSRDLNPQIKRPVYHLIDSYSYDDAATQALTDDFKLARAIEHFAGLVVSAREPELLRQEDKTEYKQKVDQFIESELYEYQWFCATHEDTKHQHTHLVASRLNLMDGRCIPTWQDKERSQRICRVIEQEHGLQPLQSYYETQRRSLTRKQRDKWVKTNISPLMVVMQDAIDQEITSRHSIDQVVEALKKTYGITAKIETYNQKPGIVFEKEDSNGVIVRMSGSQLGRGYTLPAIKQQLEQRQATDLLVRRVRNIWIREKKGRPNLTVIPFEDYQIREVGGQIHLYNGDLKLLEVNETGYQSYSLTETDCEAIQRFSLLSQAQAEERHLDAQKQAQVIKESAQSHPQPELTQEQILDREYTRLAERVRTEATSELSIRKVDERIANKVKNAKAKDAKTAFELARWVLTRESSPEAARKYVASIVGQAPVKPPPEPVRDDGR